MQASGRARPSRADRTPSQQACHSAQDDKCKVCRRLTALETHIGRAQAALQALLDERDALHARHDKDHSTIFDRLPAEVMSNVFGFFVASRAQRTSPLKLGAVCQKWRQIAWSTPDLWSKLTVHVHGFKRSLSENRVQLVQDWLSRSGALPLTILFYVSLPIPHRSVDPRHIERLVEILNQFSDQWYELDLTMPSDALALLDASSCLSPKLHSLSLSADDGELFIPTFSRFTPQIVKISCIELNPATLDWKDLTYFDVAVFPVGRILQIFRMAPNLRKCKFEYVNMEHVKDPHSAYSRVTHTELKELDIEFSSREPGELFFANLTLPGLEVLDIKTNEEEIRIDYFAPFFARSSCPLQSLTFQETDYPGDDLIHIAQLVPSLQDLYITDGEPDNLDSFYNALRGHLQTGDNHLHRSPALKEPLLPCLQVFQWCGMGSFPWKVIPNFFVALASDNYRSYRPLEKIKIECQPYEDETGPCIKQSAISRLANLAEEVAFKLTTVLNEGPHSLTEVSLKRRS